MKTTSTVSSHCPTPRALGQCFGHRDRSDTRDRETVGPPTTDDTTLLRDTCSGPLSLLPDSVVDTFTRPLV